MDISIRKAVIDNLKNATTDEVFKTIEDATTTKEEKYYQVLEFYLKYFGNLQMHLLKKHLLQK